MWWITSFIIRDLTFFPIDQVRQIRIKLIPELIYLIFYSPKNSIFQKIKKLRLIPGLMIMTQRCVKNSSFSIVFPPVLGFRLSPSTLSIKTLVTSLVFSVAEVFFQSRERGNSCNGRML